MAITATISSITQIGSSDNIEVQVNFSNGEIWATTLPISSDKPTIRQTVKTELSRRQSLEGQVVDLQSLVGNIFT